MRDIIPGSYGCLHVMLKNVMCSHPSTCFFNFEEISLKTL